jgi:hypothetical protein
MTYRYVVYDLQKNFNATFDDADFTFNQILYWVMVIANRLRVQQTMLTNSDLFTSTFNNIPVLTDSNGRKYIDLPVQIMDLQNNAGIVYLTYNEDTCSCEGPRFAQVWFQGVNLPNVQHLYLDAYTTPSASNPYFYRVGHKVDGSGVNRLYLLGVECVPVTSVEIAVKSSLDPKKLCNIDEEIPVPDEMIQDLVMQVLQLGRFIMLMPKEVTNEGEDEAELNTQMYANRAINPPQAQPMQQQQAE